jgi:hypothetical protein
MASEGASARAGRRTVGAALKGTTSLYKTPKSLPHIFRFHFFISRVSIILVLRMAAVALYFSG